MVFSNSNGKTDKDFKDENKILWERLVEVMNSKVT